MSLFIIALMPLISLKLSIALNVFNLLIKSRLLFKIY
jgi:hypothetical protein